MNNDNNRGLSKSSEHQNNRVHDVLVVDDEPAARQKLILFLQDHKDFRVVAQAQNGIEALECIEKHSPALVFLDIQMPLLDGMSVASNIEYTKNIGVVFVTGFNEYFNSMLWIMFSNLMTKADWRKRLLDFANLPEQFPNTTYLK